MGARSNETQAAGRADAAWSLPRCQPGLSGICHSFRAQYAATDAVKREVSMSRAFVKETDDPSVEVPERQQSPHPNYVTPRGLAALEHQLAELEGSLAALAMPNGDVPNESGLVDPHARAIIERDLRYVRERLRRAIPIDPAKQPQDKVAFGAIVETVDDADQKRRFEIVGEDEADPTLGRLSWISPLALALTDAVVGDVVTWKRPAGDLDLEITGISYPKS
jgi:transcription elongation GreA/GreB family factor